MMTKKHYQTIADILMDTTVDMAMVDQLCVFFKEDNHNFNEDKFKKAVGYTEGWDAPPDWDALDRYIKGEGTAFIIAGG